MKPFAAVTAAVVTVGGVGLGAVFVPPAAAVTGRAATAVSVAAPALPTNCSQAATGSSVTCIYGFTGGDQTFVLPQGDTSAAVDLIGASGSAGGYANEPAPGKGAEVSGTLVNLAGGQTLHVVVGGVATKGPNCEKCIGGFNGGGDAASAGGGGGASDIRTQAYGSGLATEDRLAVAGGGGGSGGPVLCSSTYGGSAGGDAGAPGADGRACPAGQGGGGGAGTTSGGTAGQADGHAGSLGVGGYNNDDVAGGGGGGYYGGGSGGIIDSGSAGGGGGGSSMLNGAFLATPSVTTAPAKVTITYQPGTPVALRLSPASATVVAGTAQAYTAASVDSTGAAVADVTNTTSLASGDSGATCSTSAHTCTPTIAVSHTITGTSGALQGSATLTATPGSASKLLLSPAMASQPVGSAQSYTAAKVDTYGNTIGPDTSASYSITQPGSCMGSSCTALSTGDHTVTATDGLLSGAATLTGTVGPTTTLSASGPAGATAGSPVQVTVTSADVAGDRTDYTGTVHVTSTDAQASLPADYAFTTAEHGSHTFTVTLKTAGGQSVTVTDPSNPMLAATTTSIAVSASSPASLVLSPARASQPVGSAQSYTVHKADSYGNDLGADPAATLAISGAGSCTATSCTPLSMGDHTVTATDSTGDPMLTGTAILTGTVGPTAKLVASAPGTATAGTPVSVTVTSEDVAGDRTDYTGTVHVTSSDPKAVLPADYTFTAGEHGSHTFNVTLETAGSQSVTVTDTADSTLTSSTAGTQVSPGPVAQLSISPVKTGGSIGVAQSYTATGADAYGNSLGDVTSTTSFAISPDGSCSGNACTPASGGTHGISATNQQGRATAELDVAMPTPPPAVLTIHAARSSIHFGDHVVVLGLLTQYGKALAGQTVVLTEAYTGKKQQPLGQVTTHADGTWSFRTKPAYNGTLVAHALAASAGTKVAVQEIYQHLRVSVHAHRVTLTGRLLPGFVPASYTRLHYTLRVVSGRRHFTVTGVSTRRGRSVANHSYAPLLATFTFPSGTWTVSLTVTGTPANATASSRTFTFRVS